MTLRGQILALTVLPLALASSGFAEYKLAGGKQDFYFGHISLRDTARPGQDCLVYREGAEIGEVAVVNLPLGPGDTIESSATRRCEIQFDNGSLVRLDLDSRLKIETILAQSLSSDKRLSNLVLERGEAYVMYKHFGAAEMFQVLTPNAAVKLKHNSVATIGLAEDKSTDVQVEAGVAEVLYGPTKFRLSQQKVEAKRRVRATVDAELRPAEYQAVSDFKAWNESLNQHFSDLHQGNAIPKPIQNMPTAIFNFAQQYGNAYGEWLWHDLYGYVWRPFLNDQRYPWGGWAPYVYGEWQSYRKEMYWIPGEPWGWVPYHLGIWMWDKHKGWLWLPGSVFAPAWVAWDFYFGTYAWRPWSLYDWIDPYREFWMPCYHHCRPDDVALNRTPTAPPPPPPDQKKERERNKHQRIPFLPMPNEMRGPLDRTRAALDRRDVDVLAAMSELRHQTILVRKDDLASPTWREKVIPYEQFAEEVATTPPDERAAVSDRTAREWKNARRGFGPPASDTSARRGDAASAPPVLAATRHAPALRFRDWNPDVPRAIALGVNITYSSRTNEVACPQLSLSSNHAGSQGAPWLQGGSSNSSASGEGSSSSNVFTGSSATSGSSNFHGSTSVEPKKN